MSLLVTLPWLVSATGSAAPSGDLIEPRGVVTGFRGSGSRASCCFVFPKDTILNLALTLHPLKFSAKEKEGDNMESATISDIHVVGVDGTGEQVLNGMYKEMTIDRLKRTITMLNRKPASTWESLQLYHLGNEMHNGEFESCMIAP